MNLPEILGPGCALFLDFDGTLVDIADRPDSVVVPPTLVRTLQGLQACLGGALAIVSGRPIEQIDGHLHPLVLPVAGVHGAERRTAQGLRVQADLPPLHRPLEAAEALASRHAGLQVERKRGSIALHYRLAPELESMCLAAMQEAVDGSPGLTLLKGKMVLEAKPSSVSKGHAIEAFLQEEPFTGRRPVFIGDDVTDEVGFAAVQRLGGLGVKIGPGASAAEARLADASAMRSALDAALARALEGST
jgi:trehalose 6-phosphate phosphatase